MKKKSKKYYAIIFFAVLAVLIAAVFFKYIFNLTGFTVFEDDFKNDLKILTEANGKYNTDMYSFPLTIEKDKLLLEDLNNLKNSINEKTSEPFELLLDFRTKLVESDLFYKEGWKHGKGSTTKYGFGCIKGLPRLRNATFNRNMSSQIGYEAVGIMHELIEKYPEEAEIANITLKHALFLNATFYEEQKNAVRDRRIIERACVKKDEEAN